MYNDNIKTTLNKEDRDKEIIRLRNNGETYSSIMKSLGVSSGLVSDVIKRAGLRGRERGEVKACKHCLKEFRSVNASAKFCDTKCRSNHNKKRYYRRADNKTEHHKVCASCGKEFVTNVRSYTCCSASCSKRLANYNRDIKRRLLVSSGRYDRDITLERIYERDGGVCYLCNKNVDLELDSLDNYYGSVDHVIPVARKGTHTWDNVKLAHRICNIRKSDN